MSIFDWQGLGSVGVGMGGELTEEQEARRLEEEARRLAQQGQYGALSQQPVRSALGRATQPQQRSRLNPLMQAGNRIQQRQQGMPQQGMPQQGMPQQQGQPQQGQPQQQQRMADPRMATWAGALSDMGNIAAGGQAQGRAQQYRQAALKQNEALRRQQLGPEHDIGQYNPRDYSPESWNKFLQTRDPSVLVRYQAPNKPIKGADGKFYILKNGAMMEVDAPAPDSGSNQSLRLDKADERELRQAKRLKDIETGGTADQRFQEQLGSAGGEIYSSAQKAASTASLALPEMMDLKKAVSLADTGRWADVQNTMKEWTGYGDVTSHQVLNSRLMGLAQEILNQQTGTKTDFDFKVAAAQVAKMSNTQEANKQLVQLIIDRQNKAVNFGEQVKSAFDQGGVQGVLDWRYVPPKKGVLDIETETEVVAPTVDLKAMSNDALLEGF